MRSFSTSGNRLGMPSIGLSGGVYKGTTYSYIDFNFGAKNFLDEVAELKVSKLFGILSFTLI